MSHSLLRLYTPFLFALLLPSPALRAETLSSLLLPEFSPHAPPSFSAIFDPAALRPTQSTESSSSLLGDRGEGFQWGSALWQSGVFTAVQHAGRMGQKNTRANLRGPFWRDYWDALRNTQWTRWSDGDGILTNYVAHPMMGAIAGYIQVHNDPAGGHLPFDLSSRDYWNSRLKALAWSAAYSTQFEIGPLGEAALGNVGRVPPKMALVDLVMTPVGGFALMLLEDYLDTRFISRWEQNTSSINRKKFYRLFFNPNRSLANLMRFKLPSHRDHRPLSP